MKHGLRNLAVAVIIGGLITGSPLAADAATGLPAAAVPDSAPSTGVHLLVPPPGFQPWHTAPTKLEAYGFPAQPATPAERTVWNHLLTHARHFVIPQFKTVPSTYRPVSPSIPSPAPQGTHSSVSYWQDRNWSGYTAASGGFRDVMGTWNVPDVSGSTETSYSSTWVGLGGFGVNQLIQAGTEQDAHSGLLGASTSYYVWWQMLPDSQSQQELINFPVSPGDAFTVDVTYHAATGSAQFFLEDLTSGYYTAFVVANATNDYNGATADWIVERTTVNGTLPPLAHFGTVNFADAYAATPNQSRALGSWSQVDNLTMVDSSGSTLALADALTSPTTFTDVWRQYGGTGTPFALFL